MLHERVLGLWFSILLLGAETSGTEELNRILGKTVTFQVKTTEPYRIVTWNKILGTEFVNIALVTFEEACKLLVLLPAFGKRLNVSKDCRELLLSHVEKKDAGQYRAQIILKDGNILVESFDLRVFRELLDSQLKVTCASDGARNGTWQLNCSTETWEDRVNISWTSAAKNTDPRPGSSVIQFVSQDLNATCIAENPVSKASRMVSLKQVCTERTPETEGPQEEEKGQHASSAWIVGVFAAVFFILLVIVVAVCVRKKKATKRSQRFTTHPEIENPPRSDSTLIGDQPKESRRKTNQPARRTQKTNQEMPHTIYTAVQHPKQMMRRYKRDGAANRAREIKRFIRRSPSLRRVKTKASRPSMKQFKTSAHQIIWPRSLCSTAPLSKASRGCPHPRAGRVPEFLLRKAAWSICRGSQAQEREKRTRQAVVHPRISTNFPSWTCTGTSSSSF